MIFNIGIGVNVNWDKNDIISSNLPNISSISLEIEEKIINGNQPYWRFKLSQTKIKWNDLVKGETEVDLASQSDPVLRRADGSYLYHFPSVVDDIDMKISHIIRGEDHLTNSAIHLEKNIVNIKIY